jgi:hypothetical protein
MNQSNYPLTASEAKQRQEAERAKLFHDSPVVVDLMSQLNNGLITTVEFSHAILLAWSRFQP